MAVTVSAVVAAQIAEKYPQYAEEAAGATIGDLVITTETRRLPTGGNLKVELSRHRKYRMPSGSIAVLDEPTGPTTEEILRTRVAELEAAAGESTPVQVAPVLPDPPAPDVEARPIETKPEETTA